MNNYQKLNCIDAAIHQLLSLQPDLGEENTTGYNVLMGLHNIKEDILKSEYPIQDEIWPSRRWNTKGDYIDLSGFDVSILIDVDPFKDVDFVPEP
jgi:hypothetical protein